MQSPGDAGGAGGSPASTPGAVAGAKAVAAADYGQGFGGSDKSLLAAAEPPAHTHGDANGSDTPAGKPPSRPGSRAGSAAAAGEEQERGDGQDGGFPKAPAPAVRKAASRVDAPFAPEEKPKAPEAVDSPLLVSCRTYAVHCSI